MIHYLYPISITNKHCTIFAIPDFFKYDPHRICEIYFPAKAITVRFFFCFFLKLKKNKKKNLFTHFLVSPFHLTAPVSIYTPLVIIFINLFLFSYPSVSPFNLTVPFFIKVPLHCYVVHRNKFFPFIITLSVFVLL
jgi:hypothetical protein